jgi:hypothetical protein
LYQLMAYMTLPSISETTAFLLAKRDKSNQTSVATGRRFTLAFCASSPRVHLAFLEVRGNLILIVLPLLCNVSIS